jgi:hypothetical protein
LSAVFVADWRACPPLGGLNTESELLDELVLK